MDNFGLFASSDLTMFMFYFKDPSANPLLYYYKT